MMKIIFVIICALSLSSVAQSQTIPQSQVPLPVVKSLQSKFPAISELEWKLKDELYKAEFKVGKRGHDLWIDKNGNIKKHKEDYPKSELPKLITTKIQNDFSGYDIQDVDRIEAEGKITFLVKLEGNHEKRKVLFAQDGSIQENKLD